MQKILPKQHFIVCSECNAEILVVPDVKAMSKAIQEHARLHKKHASLQRAKLVNNLSQQVLLVLVERIAEKEVKPTKVWLLIESYFGCRRVLGIALSEGDADIWVDAKYSVNPQGSFFHDTAKVFLAEEAGST